MKTRIYFIIMLLLSGVMLSAQTKIKGVVVDKATGEPIIGANIIEVGTSNGTITDFDGNFEITISTAGAKLQFSYMGYKSLELAATADMQVKMGEDAELLDEVVVIGYGVVKKNDATGSVTAIKPDDMNKGLTTNAQDMISGKLAGVVVTNEGGTPGSKANIRIRGGSSLNAVNDPLIVIDGLAMDNNGIPGSANALSMVNPSDIETFTVLKDASATAIYGSRASSGVIIITTKKGASGQKMKVTYDGNVSFGTLTNRLETLTGDEIRAYATALGYSRDAMKYLGTHNTDWQDEIYRTAVSTDHNISLTGGTKNMPYRASIGYTLNNGIVKTSQMQRVTAAINLSPTFLDKHLTFNFNAKGMYIYNSYEAGAVGSALTMDPTQPVKGGSTGIYGDVLLSDENANNIFGGYFQPSENSTYGDPVWTLQPKPNTTYNPVALLEQSSSKAKSGVFVGNLEADYKIHGFEDMHLHANFGADYSYGKQKYVNSPYGTKDGSHYYGYDGYDEKNKYNLQFNAYAQYYKDFTEKQHFDIMAGYEWQHFYNDLYKYGERYYRTTSTKTDNDGNSLAGALESRAETPFTPTESYLVSFFGRLNYIGWNQLMLTATLRADGSSRFAKKNRWGYFPSFALGWKMKETFMKDVAWLDDLKLRLGYGITGQQELSSGGDYLYLPEYIGNSSDVSYPVGGDNYATIDKDKNEVTGIIYDTHGNIIYSSVRPKAFNPDLKWEKTTTYNAGLDLAFLNNRISTSIDYYFRRTDDLIVLGNLAAGVSFRNTVLQNVGSLTNQGVEFALNAVILDYGKKFRWDFGYNITWNENKVIKINGTDDFIEAGDNISSGTGNKVQAHAIDHPTLSYYVYEAKSAVREDGSKYWYVVDRNEDGTIDESDKYFYHSPAAPVSMGLQLKFQFYNFDLGLSFRANLGNYVYNDVKASKLPNVTAANFNKDNYFSGIIKKCFTTYYVDNMRSDGMFSDADGKTSWATWYATDYFVENASFLRCDNITLGYSFKKTAVAGRVYCTVSNPFVISGYSGLDPEVWNGLDKNIYPRSMTTVIGINLQF